MKKEPLSMATSLLQRIQGRWEGMTFLASDFATLRLSGKAPSRPPLPFPLLFVYRSPSLWDHPTRSLLRWIRVQHPDVRILELAPTRALHGSPRPELVAAIAGLRGGVVLAHYTCLSLSEVALMKESGLKVVVTSGGFKSLNHGNDDVSQEESFRLFRLLDAYIVTHQPHVQELHKVGVCASYLPHWYDPLWFFPVPDMEKRFDILYIGTARDDSREARFSVLKRLSREFRLGLAGPPEDFQGLPNALLLGSIGDPRAMNELHNQARLVLGGDSLNNEVDRINRRPGQFLPYTLSHHMKHRTFCTLGSGACYLVEDHPSMRSAFSPDKEAVLWSDPEDLVERCRSLLSDAPAARLIGAEGRRRALSEHTTEKRKEEIFQILTQVAGVGA